MKLLLLGLGSPILSDDGVGLFVAREVAKSVPGLDLVATQTVGADLLDALVGYDKVVVIDAATGIGRHRGELVRVDQPDGMLHLFSSHGVNFFDLLQLGTDLGLAMPEVEAVYGIEIGTDISFGQHFSPEVSTCVESLVERISSDITARLAAGSNNDS
jgi:hydrogenase maturation protease